MGVIMNERLFKAMLEKHFSVHTPEAFNSKPLTMEAHQSWMKLQEVVDKLPELRPFFDHYIEVVCGIKKFVPPNIRQQPHKDSVITSFIAGIGVYRVLFRGRTDRRVKEVHCVKITDEETRGRSLSDWEKKAGMYYVMDIDADQHRSIPISSVITIIRIDK